MSINCHPRTKKIASFRGGYYHKVDNIGCASSEYSQCQYALIYNLYEILQEQAFWRHANFIFTYPTRKFYFAFHRSLFFSQILSTAAVDIRKGQIEFAQVTNSSADRGKFDLNEENGAKRARPSGRKEAARWARGQRI